MGSKRNEIVPYLASLGCGYRIGPGGIVADPEKTILECLKFYWISNDIIFMLYGLLLHRIGHLIHIKRLISIVKKNGLDSDELVVLLVLSRKLVNKDFPQYQMVIDKLGRKGLKMKVLPELESNSELIAKWGIDNEFSKYGAKVRKLEPSPEKKFLTLKWILQHNQWLKFRALFGVNFRSDIVYLKYSGKAETGYQAMKLSASSKCAAYEIWRTLELVDKV